jgi:hypothetical protein
MDDFSVKKIFEQVLISKIMKMKKRELIFEKNLLNPSTISRKVNKKPNKLITLLKKSNKMIHLRFISL